jgi:ribosome recycling factor
MSANPALEKKMNEVVEHLNGELQQIRTGRAQPSLVENLSVEAYGSMTPLKGVASISTPEPRVILISPWDKGLTKAIEKAVQSSDLGLNPTVTGEQVRLNIPELTAERREELIKMINSKAEAARVSLRNIREDFLKQVKQDVADKKSSEDELDRSKKEAQTVIDAHNKSIEELVEKKAEQIRTI